MSETYDLGRESDYPSLGIAINSPKGKDKKKSAKIYPTLRLVLPEGCEFPKEGVATIRFDRTSIANLSGSEYPGDSREPRTEVVLKVKSIGDIDEADEEEDEGDSEDGEDESEDDANLKDDAETALDKLAAKKV